jgi:hypothetical protein
LPPPQVSGGVQSPASWQPHAPVWLHSSGMLTVPPHMSPGLIVWVALPLLHPSVMQTVPEVARSASSFTVIVPPLPSQTICLQSPATCGGFVVVAVPDAVKLVLQPEGVQTGCWQSVVVPGHWLLSVQPASCASEPVSAALWASVPASRPASSPASWPASIPASSDASAALS